MPRTVPNINVVLSQDYHMRISWIKVTKISIINLSDLLVDSVKKGFMITYKNSFRISSNFKIMAKVNYQ